LSLKKIIIKKRKVQHWWLTPVILATWEAEKDQKDCGSKSAWPNSFQSPIVKISNTNRLAEWLKW
jgi:hypothetical protein